LYPTFFVIDANSTADFADSYPQCMRARTGMASRKKKVHVLGWHLV
jgi:hypothetical protein